MGQAPSNGRGGGGNGTGAAASAAEGSPTASALTSLLFAPPESTEVAALFAPTRALHLQYALEVPGLGVKSDPAGLRAASKISGVRAWAPPAVASEDASGSEPATMEDDAALFVPHARVGDRKIGAANSGAPSILSASTPGRVLPLYSALFREVVRHNRSAASGIGRAATAQVAAVARLRRGMKQGAARERSQAERIAKLIAEAMAAYEEDEPADSHAAASASAAASATPTSLESAAAGLLHAVQQPSGSSAAKAQVKSAVSTAVSALLSSVKGGGGGSGSGAKPSRSASNPLQQLALNTLVSTGLIFLNALQQHDPHVLHQVLLLTRDVLLELQAPSALANIRQSLLSHAGGSVDVSSVRALAPIFDLFGELIANVPAIASAGQTSVIAVRAPSSPFGNLLASSSSSSAAADADDKRPLPPSVARSRARKPAAIAAPLELTPQLLRSQCVEVSLLWSVARGNFLEIVRWINYLLASDCLASGAGSVSGFRPSVTTAGSPHKTPEYDLAPFVTLLGGYQADPFAAAQEERLIQLRDLAHAALAGRRGEMQAARLKALKRDLARRRAFIGGSKKGSKKGKKSFPRGGSGSGSGPRLSNRSSGAHRNRQAAAARARRRNRHLEDEEDDDEEEDEEDEEDEENEDEDDEDEDGEDDDESSEPRVRIMHQGRNIADDIASSSNGSDDDGLSEEDDEDEQDESEDDDEDDDDEDLDSMSSSDRSGGSEEDDGEDDDDASNTSERDRGDGNKQHLHGVLFLSNMFEAAEEEAVLEREERALVEASMLKLQAQDEARAAQKAAEAGASSASSSSSSAPQSFKSPAEFAVLPHLILREFGLSDPRDEMASRASAAPPAPKGARRMVPTPVLLLFLSAHLDRLSARLSSLLTASADKTADSAHVDRKHKKHHHHHHHHAASSKRDATYIDPLVFCLSQQSFEEMAALMETLMPFYMRTPVLQGSSAATAAASSEAAMPVSDYYAYSYMLLATLRLMGRHLCAIQLTLADGGDSAVARRYLSAELAERLKQMLWRLFQAPVASSSAASSLGVGGVSALDESFATNARLIHGAVRSTIQAILADSYQVLYSSSSASSAEGSSAGSAAESSALSLDAKDEGDSLSATGDNDASDDDEDDASASKRKSKLLTKPAVVNNKLYLISAILRMWQEEESFSHGSDATPAPALSPALVRSPSTMGGGSVFPTLVSSFLAPSSPSFLPSIHQLIVALHPSATLLASPWVAFVDKLCARVVAAPKKGAKKKQTATKTPTRARQRGSRHNRNRNRRRRGRGRRDSNGSESDYSSEEDHSDDNDDDDDDGYSSPSSGSSSDSESDAEAGDAGSDDEAREERQVAAALDLNKPFQPLFAAVPIPAAAAASSSAASASAAPPSALMRQAADLKLRQTRALQVVACMFELIHKAVGEMSKQSATKSAAFSSSSPLSSSNATAASSSASASAGDELPSIDLSLLHPGNSTFDLFNRRVAPAGSSVAGASKLPSGRSLDCTAAPWLPSVLLFFDAFQKLLFHSTTNALQLHARLAIEEAKSAKQKQRKADETAAVVSATPAADSTSVPSAAQPKEAEQKNSSPAASSSSASSSSSSAALPAVSPLSRLEILTQLELSKRYILDVIRTLLLPGERDPSAAATDAAPSSSQPLVFFVLARAPASEQPSADQYELAPVSFVLLHSMLYPLLLALLHVTRIEATPLVVALLPMLQRAFESLHAQWLRFVGSSSADCAVNALPERLKSSKASSGVEHSHAAHPGLESTSAPTPTVWLGSVLLPLFTHVLGAFSRQLLRALAPAVESPTIDESTDPILVEAKAGQAEAARAERDREFTEGPSEATKEKQAKDKAEREKNADEEQEAMELLLTEWTQHSRLLQGGLTHATLLTTASTAAPSALSLRHMQSLLQDGVSRNESLVVDFQTRFSRALPWVPAPSAVTARSVSPLGLTLAVPASPASPATPAAAAAATPSRTLSPAAATGILYSSSSATASEELDFLTRYFAHAPELAWFTTLLAKLPPPDPKASSLGRRPPAPSGPRLQKSIVEVATKASQLLFCALVRQLRRTNLCVRELRIHAERESKIAALRASFPNESDIPVHLLPPPHDRAPAKLTALYTKSLEIQALFARCKGAGGNTDALLEQIRARAYFLCFEVQLFDEKRALSLHTLSSLDVRGRPRLSGGLSAPTSPGFSSSSTAVSPMVSPSGASGLQHLNNSTAARFSPLTLTPASNRPMQPSTSAPSGLAGAPSGARDDALPEFASPALARAPSRWIRARTLIRLLSHTLGAVARLKRLLNSRKLLATHPEAEVLSAGQPASLTSALLKHLEPEVQLTQSTFLFLTADFNELCTKRKGKTLDGKDDVSASAPTMELAGVKSARYGAGAKWNDVLLKVQSLSASGTVASPPSFTASNEHFGDPLFGTVKRCEITWDDGSTASFAEGSPVVWKVRARSPQAKRDWNVLFLAQLKQRMTDQYTRSLWRMLGLFHAEHLASYLIESAASSGEDSLLPLDDASTPARRPSPATPAGAASASALPAAHPASRLLPNTLPVLLNFHLLQALLTHLRPVSAGDAVTHPAASFCNASSLSPAVAPLLQSQFAAMFKRVLTASNQLRPSHPSYELLHSHLMSSIAFLPAVGTSLAPSSAASTAVVTAVARQSPNASPFQPFAGSTAPSSAAVSESSSLPEWDCWRLMSRKVESWLEPRAIVSADDASSWLVAASGHVGSTHACSWLLRFEAWALYRAMAYRSAEVFAELEVEAAFVRAHRQQAANKRAQQDALLSGVRTASHSQAPPAKNASSTAVAAPSSVVTVADLHPSKQLVLDVFRFVHSQLLRCQSKRQTLRENMRVLSQRIRAGALHDERAEPLPRGFNVCRECFFPANELDADTCAACGSHGSLTLRPLGFTLVPHKHAASKSSKRSSISDSAPRKPKHKPVGHKRSKLKRRGSDDEVCDDDDNDEEQEEDAEDAENEDAENDDGSSNGSASECNFGAPALAKTRRSKKHASDHDDSQEEKGHDEEAEADSPRQHQKHKQKHKRAQKKQSNRKGHASDDEDEDPSDEAEQDEDDEGQDDAVSLSSFNPKSADEDGSEDEEDQEHSEEVDSSNGDDDEPESDDDEEDEDNEESDLDSLPATPKGKEKSKSSKGVLSASAVSKLLAESPKGLLPALYKGSLTQDSEHYGESFDFHEVRMEDWTGMSAVSGVVSCEGVGSAKFKGTCNPTTGAFDITTYERVEGHILMPCDYSGRVVAHRARGEVSQRLKGKWHSTLDRDYKGKFTLVLSSSTVRATGSNAAGEKASSGEKSGKGGAQTVMTDAAVDEFLRTAQLGETCSSAALLDCRAPPSPLLFLTESQLASLPARFLFSFYQRQFHALTGNVNQLLWMLLRMLHTHPVIVEKCLTLVAPVTPPVASTSGSTEDAPNRAWISMLADLFAESADASDSTDSDDADAAESAVASKSLAKHHHAKRVPQFSNCLAWITKVLSMRLLRILLPTCDPIDASRALSIPPLIPAASSSSALVDNTSAIRSLVDQCLSLVGAENLRPLESAFHVLGPELKDSEKKSKKAAARARKSKARAAKYKAKQEARAQRQEQRAQGIEVATPSESDRSSDSSESESEDEDASDPKSKSNARKLFHLAYLNRQQSVAEEAISFLRVLMNQAQSAAYSASSSAAAAKDDAEEDEEDDENAAPSAPSSAASPFGQRWKVIVFEALLEHTQSAPRSLQELVLAAGSLPVAPSAAGVASWPSLVLPHLTTLSPALVRLFGALSVLGGCLPALREGAIVEVRETLVDASHAAKKASSPGVIGAMSERRDAASVLAALAAQASGEEGGAGGGSGDGGDDAGATAAPGSSDAHIAVVLGLRLADPDADLPEDEQPADKKLVPMAYVQLTLDGERYEVECNVVTPFAEMAVPALVQRSTSVASPLFQLATRFLDAFGSLLVLPPPRLLQAHPQLSLLLLQLHRRLLQILPGFLTQKALVEHWMSAQAAFETSSMGAATAEEYDGTSPFAKHVATASLAMIDPPADLVASIAEANPTPAAASGSVVAPTASVRPTRQHWEAWLASLDRWKPKEPESKTASATAKLKLPSDSEVQRAVEALRAAGFGPSVAEFSSSAETVPKLQAVEEKQESKADGETIAAEPPVVVQTAAELFCDASAAGTVTDLYSKPLDGVLASPVTLGGSSPAAPSAANWKPLVGARELRSFSAGRIHHPPESAASPDDVASTPSTFSGLYPKPLRMTSWQGQKNGSCTETGLGAWTLTSLNHFAHYHVEGLLLTSGCWYFAVQIVEGMIHQIGAATPKFKARPSKGLTYYGVGDDDQSWIYDGSRGCLFHGVDTGKIDFAPEWRWKAGDFVGFGLSLDARSGKASMDVWGNGRHLGRAFNDMDCSGGLFPALSVDGPGKVLFLLDPRGFGRCPLPPGYKPLVSPTLDPARPLVTYPSQAYLFNASEILAAQQSAKAKATSDAAMLLLQIKKADSKETTEKKSELRASAAVTAAAAEVMEAKSESASDTATSKPAESDAALTMPGASSSQLPPLSRDPPVSLRSLVAGSPEAAISFLDPETSLTRLTVPISYPVAAFAMTACSTGPTQMARAQTTDAAPLPLDPVEDGLTLSFAASFGAGGLSTPLCSLSVGATEMFSMRFDSSANELVLRSGSSSEAEHRAPVSAAVLASSALLRSTSTPMPHVSLTRSQTQESRFATLKAKAAQRNRNHRRRRRHYSDGESMEDDSDLTSDSETDSDSSSDSDISDSPIFQSSPRPARPIDPLTLRQQQLLQLPSPSAFISSLGPLRPQIPQSAVPSTTATQPLAQTQTFSMQTAPRRADFEREPIVEEKTSSMFSSPTPALVKFPSIGPSLEASPLVSHEIYVVLRAASETSPETLQVFVNNTLCATVPSSVLVAQTKAAEEADAAGESKPSIRFDVHLPHPSLSSTTHALTRLLTKPTPAATAAPSGPIEYQILPRQTILDQGYSDQYRAWCDVTGQGVNNDYARMVGPGNGPTGVYRSQMWLSVALAGGSCEYTDVDQFVFGPRGTGFGSPFTVVRGPKFSEVTMPTRVPKNGAAAGSASSGAAVPSMPAAVQRMQAAQDDLSGAYAHEIGVWHSALSTVQLTQLRDGGLTHIHEDALELRQQASSVSTLRFTAADKMPEGARFEHPAAVSGGSASSFPATSSSSGVLISSASSVFVKRPSFFLANSNMALSGSSLSTIREKSYTMSVDLKVLAWPEKTQAALSPEAQATKVAEREAEAAAAMVPLIEAESASAKKAEEEKKSESAAGTAVAGPQAPALARAESEDDSLGLFDLFGPADDQYESAALPRAEPAPRAPTPVENHFVVLSTQPQSASWMQRNSYIALHADGRLHLHGVSQDPTSSRTLPPSSSHVYRVSVIKSLSAFRVLVDGEVVLSFPVESRGANDMHDRWCLGGNEIQVCKVVQAQQVLTPEARKATYARLVEFFTAHPIAKFVEATPPKGMSPADALKARKLTPSLFAQLFDLCEGDASWLLAELSDIKDRETRFPSVESLVWELTRRHRTNDESKLLGASSDADRPSPFVPTAPMMELRAVSICSYVADPSQLVAGAPAVNLAKTSLALCGYPSKLLSHAAAAVAHLDDLAALPAVAPAAVLSETPADSAAPQQVLVAVAASGPNPWSHEIGSVHETTHHGCKVIYCADSGYSSKRYACDLCGTNRDGPVYHCTAHKWDCCPTCLPQKITNIHNHTVGAEYTCLEHPQHKVLFLDKITDPRYVNGAYKCNVCRQTSSGFVYQCTKDGDTFDCHPRCLALASVQDPSSLLTSAKSAVDPTSLSTDASFRPSCNLSLVSRYAESHRSQLLQLASLQALDARAKLLAILHPDFSTSKIVAVLRSVLAAAEEASKAATNEAAAAGKSDAVAAGSILPAAAESIGSALLRSAYSILRPTRALASETNGSSAAALGALAFLGGSYSASFLADFFALFPLPASSAERRTVLMWMTEAQEETTVALSSTSHTTEDQMVSPLTGLTASQAALVRGGPLPVTIEWATQEAQQNLPPNVLPKPLPQEFESQASLDLTQYLAVRRTTEQGLVALYARELVIHSLKVWNDASSQMQPSEIRLQRATSKQQQMAAAAAAAAAASSVSAEDDDLPPPSGSPLSRTASNSSTSSARLPALTRSVSVMAATSAISFPFARFGSIAFLPRLLRVLDHEHSATLLGDATSSASSASSPAVSDDRQQMERTIKSIVIGEMFALESLIYSSLLLQHQRSQSMSITALDRSAQPTEYDRLVGPTPTLLGMFEEHAPICAQLLRETLSQLLSSMLSPSLLEPSSSSASASSSAAQLALPSPRFIIYICLLFLDRLNKLTEQEQKLRTKASASTDPAVLAKSLAVEAMCSLLFPPPMVHALFCFTVLHPSISVRITFLRLLQRVYLVAPISPAAYSFFTAAYKSVDHSLDQSASMESSKSTRLQPSILQKVVIDTFGIVVARYMEQQDTAKKEAARKRKAQQKAQVEMEKDRAATVTEALSTSDDKAAVAAAMEPTSDAVSSSVVASASSSSASSSSAAASPPSKLSAPMTGLLALLQVMQVLCSDVPPSAFPPEADADGSSSSSSALSAAASAAAGRAGFLSGFVDLSSFPSSSVAQVALPRTIADYKAMYERRAPAHAVRLYSELSVYINRALSKSLSFAENAKKQLDDQATFVQMIGVAMALPAAADGGIAPTIGSKAGVIQDVMLRALSEKNSVPTAAGASKLPADLCMAHLDREISKYPALAKLSVTEFTYHALLLHAFNAAASKCLYLFDLTAAPSPAAIAMGHMIASGSLAGASADRLQLWTSPFTLPPTPYESLHTSHGFDALFCCKSLLFTHVKTAWLAASLARSKQYSSGSLELDTFRAQKAVPGLTSIGNIRKTCFGQAWRQLHTQAHRNFRIGPNERAFNANMIGMHASDAGGPYREALNDITKELQSNRLPFFVPVPNAASGAGLNRDCFVPRPYFVRPSPFASGSVSPLMSRTYLLRKQCYRFIGQLCGLAIRTKYLLPLNLAPIVWKLLVHEEASLKDIEAIDQLSFALLADMQRMANRIKERKAAAQAAKPATNSIAAAASSMAASMDAEEEEKSSSSASTAAAEALADDSLDDLLNELKFEVVAADGGVHDLLPHGRSLGLTSQNWQQYAHLLRQFRLHEYDAEIAEIRCGLHSVVPAAFVQLLSGSELRMLVVGSGEHDFELLQRMTTVAHELQDTPTIKHFWSVLKTRFTKEQQSKFLTFVWGRSTLPSREADFERKLNIQLLREGSDPDKNLPVSHTCFFGIDIPMWTTEEVTYQKLLYAVENCSTIDADSSIVTSSGRADDEDQQDEQWGFE